jgi:hypothetical protein
MKQITNNTVISQSNTIFQPIEINKIFYWVKEINNIEYNDYHISSNKIKHCTDVNKMEDVTVKKIVAQSERMLPNIPVVNQSTFLSQLCRNTLFPKWDTKDVFSQHELNIRDGFYKGYESNNNQYSLNDVLNTIQLARKFEKDSFTFPEFNLTIEEILKKINSIKIFYVDEQFKILNYE